MKNILYKNLFSFEVKNNLKISSSKNEIYNQLLLYIFNSVSKNLVILTPNINSATHIYNALNKYTEDIYFFPDDDYLTKKAIASSPELLFYRLKLLNNIKSNNNKKIVICHLNSFIKKLPNFKSFNENKILIKKNEELNRDKFLNLLDKIGYKKDFMVNNVGEYCVRGFIIDVFSIEEDHPIRIELFGSTIEEIRYFDENTQLSLNKLKEHTIKPIVDEFNNNDSSLIDYLDNPFVIIQDINQIVQTQKNLLEQIKYYGSDSNEFLNFDENDIKNKIYIDLVNNVGNYNLTIKAKEIINYNENLDKFLIDLKSNKNSIIVSDNKKFLDKLKKENLNLKIIDEKLNSGFVYKDEYYYSENDLKKVNGSLEQNKIYKSGKKITSLDRLKIGDYVVHKVNGIGIYMGIKTITKDNVMKDYILIKYKGNDKLYLPVENIDKLYKYSSKEGTKPIIYKLNSNEWKKTKLKIKSKIKDISDELLKIYRKRQTTKVIPFEKDNEIQEIFESEFIYEETLDQLKVSKEIKSDLESDKPMDRLLCGDVGYGKTEVIFRTIFKTVMNNKQVMYLCPTTVLSYQQYLSAQSRFKNFAVNIQLLNRNKTKKETREIIDNLKNGKIDVIFGTHRLLSKDVEFNNLGLLIIDEEHRFGVEHKERIKKFKENVHVLSVSATPIPRSLQMSLIGIRDLSLIDTPPKKRYPVQTYVIEYNELLLREAVIKEINRDGQVFILYNKIDNIEAVCRKFSDLIPEAKIRYAHGKVDKEQMQNTLIDFMNNEFNVLVSTTIIENGIDIPNANTMIIIDSDRFGLSQLYQIRGRVGRSDRIAYAYLMYNKSKMLTETALKRLDAIKEFTELGSGYKISMRDLSIRGAGDILGSEQAGFIDSVGMELYLELVNESVNNIEEDAEEKSNIITDVSTHIDDNYSDDDEIIIDLHKKINDIDNINDLKELKTEIEDRFGTLDETIEIYMYETLLEKMMNKFDIKLFENTDKLVSIRLGDALIEKLNVEDLFIKSIKINSKFKFTYKNKFLLITLTKTNLEKHYIYYLYDFVSYIEKEVKFI